MVLYLLKFYLLKLFKNNNKSKKRRSGPVELGGCILNNCDIKFCYIHLFTCSCGVHSQILNKEL